MPTDALLKKSESAANGLTSAEAQRRLAAGGPNTIKHTRRDPLWLRFLRQFWSVMAALLWVAGILAILAGMQELGYAIFGVIVINGAFGFLQEYRAERAIEALEKLLPSRNMVLRDGKETRLDASQIVIGDVVCLEQGDQVPADGQMIAANELQIDQSSLTGESFPQTKVPADNTGAAPLSKLERRDLIFAGTGVVSGSGRMAVTATGMATEIGTIANLTQTVREQPSPLQLEIAHIVRIVTVLSVVLGGVFFALGMASGKMNATTGFFFALGVIVANVPEGLLPTITLGLALGVQRMARQGSLIKRLSSVETLGATTVICTDKTGTITKGTMEVSELWSSGRTVKVSDAGAADDQELRGLLCHAMLASQALSERGNPMETAIFRYSQQLKLDGSALVRERPSLSVHPFDSFRKRMSIVRESGSAKTVYVKGAPLVTLGLCTSWLNRGAVEPLTAATQARIRADHDALADRGLRVLAVCERNEGPNLERSLPAELERELTFVGMIAFWDPPRAEVAGAMEQCTRAGIRVIMITGDDGRTAQSIARQIGLPVSSVMTGDELATISPEALRETVKTSQILFARTSPQHKLAIVKALKENGEIVAVTGDGVNDSPALKMADIGVAMGIRGTEVAKEAAEMVITDDNFASIISAIREGRTIYSNIGKLVTYVFASNVPELIPFLCFVFLGIPLPLTVLQILAVDLGTDMFPALALGSEPPEPGIMDLPPRKKSDHLLGFGRLARAYLFLGLIEAALAMFAFYGTYWLAGWRPGALMDDSGELYRHATTMTLTGIVAAQIGNVFACRSERASIFSIGLFSNPRVFWGIAAELAILALLIFVPFLRAPFGLAIPTVRELSLLLAFPFVLLSLEELRKVIVRVRATGPRRAHAT